MVHRSKLKKRYQMRHLELTRSVPYSYLQRDRRQSLAQAWEAANLESSFAPQLATVACPASSTHLAPDSSPHQSASPTRHSMVLGGNNAALLLLTPSVLIGSTPDPRTIAQDQQATKSSTVSPVATTSSPASLSPQPEHPHPRTRLQARI
jgi:hypothetical protein